MVYAVQNLLKKSTIRNNRSDEGWKLKHMKQSS